MNLVFHGTIRVSTMRNFKHINSFNLEQCFLSFVTVVCQLNNVFIWDPSTLKNVINKTLKKINTSNGTVGTIGI